MFYVLCLRFVSTIDRPTFTFSYDWALDVPSCKWREWSRDVPSCSIGAAADAGSIIVPTVDDARHSSVMRMLLMAGGNVLFVGATGTGEMCVASKVWVCGVCSRADAHIHAHVYTCSYTHTHTHTRTQARLS